MYFTRIEQPINSNVSFTLTQLTRQIRLDHGSREDLCTPVEFPRLQPRGIDKKSILPEPFREVFYPPGIVFSDEEKALYRGDGHGERPTSEGLGCFVIP